jgi:hypothetical protein
MLLIYATTRTPPKPLLTLHELLGWFPGFGVIHVVTYVSNTASVLSEAGTTYPSGAPVFIPGFGGVRVVTYVSNRLIYETFPRFPSSWVFHVQNRIKHSNMFIFWSRSNTLHWTTVRHLKEYSWVWSCPGSNPSFHIESQKLIGIRVTRRVPLVEQELPTLPEHLTSPLVFNGVRVTQSLVLYVCFVDRCLPFCTFSFGYCVVCSSSLYGFWLNHKNLSK